MITGDGGKWVKKQKAGGYATKVCLGLLPSVGVRFLSILSVCLGCSCRRLGSVVIERWSSCLLVVFVFVVGIINAVFLPLDLRQRHPHGHFCRITLIFCGCLISRAVQ